MHRRQEQQARRWWLAGIAAGSCWLAAASVLAGDLRPSSYSFEGRPAYSSGEREDYLSRGQKFLRDYLREQFLNLMAAHGLSLETAQLQEAVTLDVTRLYAGSATSLRTRMRVYADQSLDSYRDCGRFLPVEVQLDSQYLLSDGVVLKAKLTTPFDDVSSLHLGSEVLWQPGVHSNLEYRLRSGSQIYAGFNFGLAFQLARWDIRWDSSIAPDFESLNCLSLSTAF